MWALLSLYQALRIAVTDAGQTVPGTDPDRASYQIAVQAAQATATHARNAITGPAALARSVGRAVLADLLPPGRPRGCPRRVKSPLSRWNKRPPGKPRQSQRVTSITTSGHREHQEPAAARRQQCVTTACGP